MERKRVPGYITTQSTNNFGLDVKVQRETAPSSGFPPSGDPIPEGQDGLDPNATTFTNRFRDVIPPGEIGSSDREEDLTKLGPPQYVDTVQHYTGEQADPSLHGSPAAIRSAGRTGVPFQPFDSFQPRSAPMPRAAQDEGLLEPYGYHAADPQMTDDDSTTSILGRRNANRLDLDGPSRDGVAHNDNVAADAAQGVSQILGDTMGSAVGAAGKAFPGQKPGKTAPALREPKPPTSAYRKTGR